MSKSKQSDVSPSKSTQIFGPPPSSEIDPVESNNKSFIGTNSDFENRERNRNRHKASVSEDDKNDLKISNDYDSKGNYYYEGLKKNRDFENQSNRNQDVDDSKYHHLENDKSQTESREWFTSEEPTKEQKKHHKLKKSEREKSKLNKMESHEEEDIEEEEQEKEQEEQEEREIEKVEEQDYEQKEQQERDVTNLEERDVEKKNQKVQSHFPTTPIGDGEDDVPPEYKTPQFDLAVKEWTPQINAAVTDDFLKKVLHEIAAGSSTLPSLPLILPKVGPDVSDQNGNQEITVNDEMKGKEKTKSMNSKQFDQQENLSPQIGPLPPNLKKDESNDTSSQISTTLPNLSETEALQTSNHHSLRDKIDEEIELTRHLEEDLEKKKPKTSHRTHPHHHRLKSKSSQTDEITKNDFENNNNEDEEENSNLSIRKPIRKEKFKTEDEMRKNDWNESERQVNEDDLDEQNRHVAREEKEEEEEEEENDGNDGN